MTDSPGGKNRRMWWIYALLAVLAIWALNSFISGSDTEKSQAEVGDADR